MGLRWKIFSGFLILSLMLVLAGVWSIVQIRGVGLSVRGILDDNYRSIQAAKAMLEALEREDSAVLLLLLGEEGEGRAILASADSVFTASLSFAEGNVTMPGEGDAIGSLRESYDAYRTLWSQRIVGTDREGNLEWYSGPMQDAFGRAKGAVNALMSMNDGGMYETASRLQAHAKRAAMPGVVAIVAAVVFSLLFSSFVHAYMVDPLLRIAIGAEEFAKGGKSFDVDVRTGDEIERLATAVRDLCSRVAAARRSP
jgi:HAMP domain-containing protein